jgi:hypothetical protein
VPPLPTRLSLLARERTLRLSSGVITCDG